VSASTEAGLEAAGILGLTVAGAYHLTTGCDKNALAWMSGAGLLAVHAALSAVAIQ
jgi:hypothetical protein